MPFAVARRAESPTKQTPTLTGSPIQSEPDFILVGVVRRPHGLKGEVIVSLDTDFPEQLIKGAKFYLGDDHIPVTIGGRRTHADGLLLAFEEFPDKPSVARLQNVPLFSRATELPELPAGKFYQHQLIGLQVIEENGSTIGRLTQIFNTGANDVYIVRDSEGKEILLPAIRDVIKQVELEEKRIVVHLLPGLK